MIGINKGKFWRDYNKLKKSAHEATRWNKIEDSYCLIQTAAKIAYNLPFTYADDELESIIQKIAGQSLITKGFSPCKNRFVLYDSFGMDNKGLTQQYLRALINWKVDFLYIFDSTENSDIGQDIYQELNDHESAEIYITPKDCNCSFKKSQLIIERIQQYCPETAFIHIAPWSVMAIGIWSQLPIINRYMIDITDHSFWLGKTAADYFIGFRNYGNHISNYYRGIEKYRLLTQKYYPIVNKNIFQGFPKLPENKVVILCGSNYYKIYGKSGIFLEILKRVANENQNCIILFAGSGNVLPFKKFIKKHNLQDRIILIGERNDINEVVKRSDIMLATYPFGGGLMTQYALINAKPLIAYESSDLSLSSIDYLLQSKNIPQIIFNDINLFYMRINKLINCSTARQEMSERLEGCVLSPEEFATDLKRKIEYNKSSQLLPMTVNRIAIEDLYCELENDWIKQYEFIKIINLKGKYFYYDLVGAFKAYFFVFIRRFPDIPNWVIRKLSN